MRHRSWLERVADELARRRVPAGRRARLLGELRDHLDDLTEGGRTMAEQALEAVLGRPEEVAAGAAEEYRRAGWVRRHALLVFGLAPLPAALVGLVLYLLVAMGVAWVWGQVGDPEGPGTRALLGRLITGYAYTIGFVPFLLCAALFGRMAVKHRAGGWWLALAVAQVAFVGWTVAAGVTLSDVPGKSSLMLGLRFPPWGEVSVLSSLQLALPLAVGMIYLRPSPKQESA
jgi:hypothetical protein